MGVLGNIMMNVGDMLSTKTPSERKLEVLSSAKELEYYASRMELAHLRVLLDGNLTNINAMRKAYEKTANKIALNLLALDKVQGIDKEINDCLKNHMTPAAKRYAEVNRRIATGEAFLSKELFNAEGYDGDLNSIHATLLSQNAKLEKDASNTYDANHRKNQESHNIHTKTALPNPSFADEMYDASYREPANAGHGDELRDFLVFLLIVIPFALIIITILYTIFH